MTQSALATDLDLTRVAIGNLLDRMENAGFVERRSDPNDRRSRRVHLTRPGQQIVVKIRASVDRLEPDLLASISDEQLNQAAETLVILKRNLLRLASLESLTTDEGIIADSK